MFSTLIRSVKKYRIYLITLCIALTLRVFVFDIFIVSGNSMYPTLRDGDILVIDKISYKFFSPRISDIVLSEHNNMTIIKRVIAKENDTVQIKNNRIYVNNTEKISNVKSDKQVELSVPSHSYYVIGDNLNFSVDSRNFGPIIKDEIKGRLFLHISLGK